MAVTGGKFKEIDALIRVGRLSEASALLDRCLRKPMPRAALPLVASFARRLRRPGVAIRLLGPLVRPTGQRRVPAATDREKAEYAGALIRLGALSEAEAILDGASAEREPLVWLFRAFAAICQWRYAEALPPLERFLEACPSGAYELTVADVNRMAALVFVGRRDEARAGITRLVAGARADGNRILEMNLLELAAQNEVRAERWEAALAFLDEAERAIGGPEMLEGSLDGFFVRKWRAVVRLLSSGGEPGAVAEIRSLRDEAERWAHPESARDLDLTLARVLRDRDRFAHLYFGTPAPAMQRRISESYRALWGEPVSALPLPHSWRLGDGPRKVSVHGTTGASSVSTHFLKLGQVQQRLFFTLTLDFYRPLRLVELFTGVFPGEPFSLSSADRAHQALGRLRAFFRRAQLPLVVRERDGFYRLEAVPGFTVEIVCERKFSSTGKTEFLVPPGLELDRELARFQKEAGGVAFAAREFAESLSLSRRSAIRRLTEACATGRLARRGRGRSVCYEFVKSPS